MVRQVEPLLGTRAEVDVAAEDPAVVRSAEQAIVDEVARLERVFSVFDEDSSLMVLRRTGVTDVDELRAVVDLAGRWRERTDGLFHPAMHPLVDLWDRAEVAGVVPSPDALDRAVAAMDCAGVEALDLNAIAKGWIAERAMTEVLSSVPEASAAWVSLGGDVVHRGVGSIAVGIEDPRRPYDNVAPLATIEVSNQALATSGGARRWWTIDGRRYPKVLDPRSGRPVDRCASATVVAADAATADVLATVATVATTDETLALADDAGAICLLVHHDGSVTSSSASFRPS